MRANGHKKNLAIVAIGAVGALLLLDGASRADAPSNCSPKPPSSTRLVHAAPPPELRAHVAELRREQNVQDRLPPHTLRAYPDAYTAVSIDYVRLLHTFPDGRRFYLIPATFYYPFVPKRCFNRLSPRFRRQALRDQRHARGYSHRLALGVMFTRSRSRGANVSGTATRANARDLLHGRSVAAFGRGPRGPSLVFGLVPDGVDVVVLHYRHGWHRFDANRNFWSANVPESASAAIRNQAVWETKDGGVVARFPSRRRGELRTPPVRLTGGDYD